MHISHWMKEENITQSALGKIIKRDRVRAHRIVHGAKPDDEEMNLIYQASKGRVDANSFYKLKHINGAINHKNRKVK